MGFQVDMIRQDFPILGEKPYGKNLVYLDNAASAQKPKAVIEAMQQMQLHNYANVHRGLHYLSNKATDEFEQARHAVRNFINAPDDKNIIFTSGATDSINLVADSYLAPRIQAGDEIILTLLEHHANIVPWHFLRERYGAVLKFVPIKEDGNLDMHAYHAMLSPKVKMVAVTQMSNALGVIPPLAEIITAAHGFDIPILVDGCQGVVHEARDVQAMNADFYVFSGHKLYGPTGIGILYGKTDLLEEMRPYRGGGEMIREVMTETVTYGDVPHRFEAGTPPIIEAIGLKAAIDYIQKLDEPAAQAHEATLLNIATEAVREMNKVHIHGDCDNKKAVLSFSVEGVHPHDLAMIMDREGVAVRAGHHCAQPLMEALGVSATTRASFAFYNCEEELALFVKALDKAIRFF